MNRREFIVGIVGTIAIAGIAPKALLEPVVDYNALRVAINAAMIDYQRNFLLYGVGALIYQEEFPFVKSLSPSEIYAIPELHRAEGNFS